MFETSGKSKAVTNNFDKDRNSKPLWKLTNQNKQLRKHNIRLCLLVYDQSTFVRIDTQKIFWNQIPEKINTTFSIEKVKSHATSSLYLKGNGDFFKSENHD